MAKRHDDPIGGREDDEQGLFSPGHLQRTNLSSGRAGAAFDLVLPSLPLHYSPTSTLLTESWIMTPKEQTQVAAGTGHELLSSREPSDFWSPDSSHSGSCHSPEVTSGEHQRVAGGGPPHSGGGSDLKSLGPENLRMIHEWLNGVATGHEWLAGLVSLSTLGSEPWTSPVLTPEERLQMIARHRLVPRNSPDRDGTMPHMPASFAHQRTATPENEEAEELAKSIQTLEAESSVVQSTYNIEAYTDHSPEPHTNMSGPSCNQSGLSRPSNGAVSRDVSFMYAIIGLMRVM